MLFAVQQANASGFFSNILVAKKLPPEHGKKFETSFLKAEDKLA